MVRLEHPADDLYLRAAAYEQWEPVYGDPPRIETAGPIRGASGFGLAEVTPRGMSLGVEDVESIAAADLDFEGGGLAVDVDGALLDAVYAAQVES